MHIHQANLGHPGIHNGLTLASDLTIRYIVQRKTQVNTYRSLCFVTHFFAILSFWATGNIYIPYVYIHMYL